MELDQATLNKILGLSDGELTDAVTRIALGLGLNQDLLKPYLKDTAQIRAALRSVTPADLDRVAAALGEEQTREMLNKIRNEADRV